MRTPTSVASVRGLPRSLRSKDPSELMPYMITENRYGGNCPAAQAVSGATTREQIQRICAGSDPVDTQAWPIELSK